MTQPSNGVLFISEVSANHLGSLQRAKDIVIAAAKAGATAVKFQTYTADTMTLDIDNFKVSDDHELWGGRRLYSLYEEAYTPWEWHPELFELCRSLDVLPFSSPFDLSAVELLESLNAPMYKIASLETGDHRLIRAVAETGKPLIISTGATEWDEIEDLVGVVQKAGNKDLTLMVCTSSYPSDPIDAHLNRIATLRNHFGVKVGLSDHTLGMGVSIAAIALGEGQELVAALAIVTAGSTLGFLMWNKSPAKIYMGDAGALFLGIIVSVLTIRLNPGITPQWSSIALLPMLLADSSSPT